MTADLSVSLAQLKKASGQLNKLTDKANHTVRTVEKFLVEECNAGSPTSVPTGVVVDGHLQHLVYRKYSGKFRISVSLYDLGKSRYLDFNLWSNCDRDTKLAAIQVLPDLIDAIRTELDNKISGAKSAIEQLHQAMPALENEED